MARFNSDALAASFDRRLARRSHKFPTGTSNSGYKEHATPESVAAGVKGNRTRIALGTQNLKTPVKTAYNRQFQSPKTTGTTSSSAFKASINNIFDEATKELVKRQNQEYAIAMAQQNKPEEDRGFWQDFAMWGLEHAVPAPVKLFRAAVDPGYVEDLNLKAEQKAERSSWEALMENFSNSPAGRALDVVSRPFYAVNEFMKGTLEADYAGEDFWQSLGHGLGEAKSGLAGTEKTGFGDVVETYLEGSKSAPAGAFREFQEGNPDAAQWIKRGAGLAGDIAIDPLKAVHPGASTVIAATGQEATESGIKSVLRGVADTAARDALDDILFTRRGGQFRPSADAVSMRAINNAETKVENALLEISGGSRGGFSKMGGEHFAQAAANSVAESVRTSILEPFEKRLADLTAPVGAGRSPNMIQMRSHIARNPEFAEMLDEVENALAAKGRVYQNQTDMLADLGAKGDLKIIEQAAETVRARMGPYWQAVADDVYAQTRDITYNTISVRLPTGKNVPIKTVGKAWKAIKDSSKVQGQAASFEDAARAISYEHNMPGRISLLTQRSRSLGRENFEHFRDNLATIARKYTPEQAKEIQWALDEGRTLTGHLEVARREIEKLYRQIMVEEVAAGVRNDTATGAGKFADDYTYIYNRGGSKEKRTQFKEGRKKEIHNSGNKGRWGMATAVADGLKPVENAFEALLLRKMKSSRDLTRAYFMKDLVDNYGLMTKKLSPAEIRGRNLVNVTERELDQGWRQLLRRDKSNMYLPKAHADMFDLYKEMSSFDPRQGGRPLRTFNKITSMLKWASTVPRPGFHIRNMIGDYFMGLLDNVPTKTYSEVAGKWEAWKRLGKMPRFQITKRISHSIEEMWNMYENYANTGFFETELEHMGVSGGIKGKAGKVAEKLRTASEKREDFGRFTHFVAAYRQEAQALLGKGMKEGSRLEQKALEAAVWRVNHFKFDYNALTATERKMKLAFPFYTFTRKATPTLLESLLISPHYMGVANRFMQLHDGSSADAFNSYYLPDYVKDTGYAFLGQDSPEPFFLRGDILPTNTLNNLDFTNSQQFAQSVVQQMNPLLQVGPELATQEQFFSGRPTGSALDYALNKLPVGMNVAREVQGGNEPGWLARVNNTFTGLGIPLEQFTQARQDQGFREAEDRFVQDPMYDFNRSQERFQVYQSNRSDGTMSFVLKDTTTGATMDLGQNPREAINIARQFASKG